jgi:hypothetical protein
MMTAEQLRTLCAQIRARQATGGPPPGSPEVDDELVHRIESDVREYRSRFLTRPAPQLPPDPLRERLPLMGWLIYEASLDRLWDVKPKFEDLDDAAGKQSRAAAALIRRLANAARTLVWPEFAPRALGAIRAQALVESKRDNESGYDAAWVLHNEADDKHASFLDTHGSDPARGRYVLDLQEVLLQLALAETGTACRTAERVIGRWDEEFRLPDPQRSQREGERWTQRMFKQLTEGIEIGERALATARTIKVNPGFAHRVTEDRLTLVTGLRNPSIMTCRAILLTYSMCPEMHRLNRTPPAPAETWTEYQEGLLGRFDTAFDGLCAAVQKEDKSNWPLNADHRRSLVQLCLHLALVTPRHELPQDVKVDDSLTLRTLDDDAVEEMSAWLATEVNGAQRGDANTIGTASMPDFITSVEACRLDPGAAADYRNWRLRWSELDRYAREPGRAARIAEILR